MDNPQWILPCLVPSKPLAQALLPHGRHQCFSNIFVNVLFFSQKILKIFDFSEPKEWSSIKKNLKIFVEKRWSP